MISRLAVIPGAPALLPGLMGTAAREVDAVRSAAVSAVSTVVSGLFGPGGQGGQSGQMIGRLVVVGVAPSGLDAGSRSHDIAGELTDSSFGSAVQLASLPGARPADPMLRALSGGKPSPVPTPLLVARSVCGRVVSGLPAADALWAEALWVTVTSDAAADFGRTLAHDDAPIGLVLVADGAACHGPKAPRAEDARAVDYDDAVCSALTAGDPAAVASLDAGLGRDLSAEGAGLWPLLSAATNHPGGTTDWRAELLWRGAPYGVGWFVATWQRCRSSPRQRPR